MAAVLESRQADLSLAQLKKGDYAVVLGMADSDVPEQIAAKTRLMELGFVPGERIRVIAESFPHRDPIAVRIGNTTFALRRHEAELVQVTFAAVKQAEVVAVLP